MWEVSSTATAHAAFLQEQSRSTYRARGGTKDTSLVLGGLLIPTYQADAGQANATMCFGPIPSCVADRPGAPCNVAISADIKTLGGIAGSIFVAISRGDR